jgi:hypothetical protein
MRGYGIGAIVLVFTMTCEVQYCDHLRSMLRIRPASGFGCDGRVGVDSIFWLLISKVTCEVLW